MYPKHVIDAVDLLHSLQESFDYNAASHRRVRTRAITSINENTRVNKALWMLANKMRELVS